jgi:ribosomal protein S18 acetylase RimI-like enzyme
MNPVFRKATESDKENVANVLVSAYNIDSVRDGIDAFLEECGKKYNFVVAEIDGKIVGIASYQVHGLPKHQVAELDRIVVLPEFRGKGIAKQLFDFLVKEANKFYEQQGFRLRKLYLLTHGDNIHAHEFYKKLGFKTEASLKDHFYKGKNELVMSVFF